MPPRDRAVSLLSGELRNLSLSLIRKEELQLVTDRFFLVGGRALKGHGVVLLAISRDHEDGYLDVYKVFLKSSSIRRILRRWPFDGVTEINDVNIVSKDQEFTLAFAPQLNGAPGAKLAFDRAETVEAVRLLSHHSGTRPSRLCLCESGKRFKDCCSNEYIQSKLTRIPRSSRIAELNWIYESDSQLLESFYMTLVEDSELASDSEFWSGFGTACATAGYPDYAVQYFDRSLDLDGENHGARLNKAVALTGAGRGPEALELIHSVAEGTERKAVIWANTLVSAGKWIDAVPLYEAAIQEEPEFFFPYHRLLGILRTSDYPSYEYWVNQAVEVIPSSPEVAWHYAQLMLELGRFEELAGADWIENASEEFDPTVIGGHAQSLYKAKAITLRDIGKAFVTNDEPCLQEIVERTLGLNDDERDCLAVRCLLILCSSLGAADYLSPLHRLLHDAPHCAVISEADGQTVGLRSLTANALLIQAEYESIVALFESDSESSSQENGLLNAYWWALDELGRKDEAIEFAKMLRARVPSLRHLSHNIGLMCQESGALGEAKIFYQQQLQEESHPWSAAALAVINLMEGDFDTSRDWFGQYIQILQDPDIYYWYSIVGLDNTSSIESSQLRQLDQIDSLIRDRISTDTQSYADLVEFSNGHRESPTFALDVAEYNERSEPLRIGPNSKILARSYSLSDLAIQGSHKGNDGGSLAELAFLGGLEARGDYSIPMASLQRLLTDVGYLPERARIALLEAERRFLSKVPMLDYTPAMVNFAKSLEICIREMVFKPFRESWHIRSGIESESQTVQGKQNQQLTGLLRYIENGSVLELGTVAHILRLCNGKSARKEPIIGALKSFINDGVDSPELLATKTIESIEFVSQNIRNPGVHDVVLNENEFERCRLHCIDLIDLVSRHPHHVP